MWRNILVVSIIAALVLAVLYLAVGGMGLAVGVGALFWLVSVVVAFMLGAYYTKQTLAAGADIALKAQTSDDRRDIVQTNALTGLVKEVLKLGGQAARVQAPSYPRLPDEGVVDAQFTIKGLDE